MQKPDTLCLNPLRLFRLSIFCFLILAILSPAGIAAEMKPGDAALELQTLEDFHSAAESLARKPAADADDGYRSKLEKAQKAAQAAGNLKSVLAAKQAVADLDAGRPPVVSDNPDVAAIQKTYMAQRQKADADSEKALAKADQDYLTSLKKLVVELTKAGHIDQAQQVQAEADELTAKLSPKAVPPAAGGQELDIWKKKALEEFPALKDQNSALSKQVQTLKESRKSPPDLKDPRWPYLLAKEASLELARAEAARRSYWAPGDAKPFNEKKYRVYDEECSWTVARDKCRKLGGRLAMIPDAATQKFIAGFANGKRLWLGASKEETKDRWSWVDGSEMIFKSFNRGEPSATKGENFLGLESNGLWNNFLRDADSIGGYICEWPYPTPPAE